MLLKSLSFVLIFSLSPLKPAHSAVPEISEGYKLVHNLLLSLGLSAYYTGSDSNKLTADMTQWQFDWITQFNILWRATLFAPINYLEFSYLPDGLAAGTLTQADVDFYKGWMLFAGSTSSMITYNSRYEDVLVSRYDEYKSYCLSLGENASTALASFAILMRNMVWFYTFPKLLKPINGLLLSNLPRQQDMAKLAYTYIPIQAIQLITFSVVDALYKHVLVSIKHTAWQFLPTAQDLRLLRFDDCTTCYFGTNVMGRNGTIGSNLRAARDRVIEKFYPSEKDEL